MKLAIASDESGNRFGPPWYLQYWLNYECAQSEPLNVAPFSNEVYIGGIAPGRATASGPTGPLSWMRTDGEYLRKALTESGFAVDVAEEEGEDGLHLAQDWRLRSRCPRMSCFHRGSRRAAEERQTGS